MFEHETGSELNRQDQFNKITHFSQIKRTTKSNLPRYTFLYNIGRQNDIYKKKEIQIK